MQNLIKRKTTTPLKNPINPTHTHTELQNKAKFPPRSRKSLNELTVAPCATTWGAGWKRKGHEKTPHSNSNTSHIWPSILHPPSSSHARHEQPWANRVALLLKSCWCLLQSMSPPIPHLTTPAAPSSYRATQKSREIK